MMPSHQSDEQAKADQVYDDVAATIKLAITSCNSVPPVVAEESAYPPHDYLFLMREDLAVQPVIEQSAEPLAEVAFKSYRRPEGPA